MRAASPLRALRRLYRRLAGPDTADAPTPPVRGELLGPDRLRRHARRLAEIHVLDRRERAGAPVLDRLDENAEVLRAAYGTLASAVRQDEAVSPAAEWLLDNFHVIEEQVREARESLPEGYQRQLPKLEEGELADHPRVFGLVWEVVKHTDSRFDPEHLRAFIEAYQESSPLTMGEVWAIPASYRLVLLENLRRLARVVVRARRARAEADAVAEAVREAADENGDPLDPLRPFERPDRPADRAFVVELAQRLRLEESLAAPALAWLEQKAARAGTSLEELVRAEHADQLAAQATVANVVTAMRTISAYDWAEFFEGVSVVEQILRRDPSDVYPSSDFATRDAYRHVVEELARGSGLREEVVALRLIERVSGSGSTDWREGRGGGGHERRSCYLGYHLLRDGRGAFERELDYHIPLSRRLYRAFVAAPHPGYFGTLAVVTGALLALPIAYATSVGASIWLLLVVLLMATVPAMDLAVAVLHQDVTELVPPDRLPKLKLKQGVPRAFTTVVAVPMLLESEEDVQAEVERLEERYLANPEGHLVFALLSDWTDAPHETMPDDEGLLGAAAASMAELNERYGPGPEGQTRFLLLHRRRVWSPTEQVWMGWERKRGKLVELNRLLRGDEETTYVLRVDGLTDLPTDARFVLALDADTRLPPGAARRLVGAIAHPLNRPWLEEELGRVTEGYGILQPRITALLPSAGKGSLYHRLYAGPTGIDPYSAASSDVYQDLFGEGTFVGKGIYDVDAFQGSLEGRVPDGALLSHDHFEGAFARCGLASDVELFDEFPSRYEANLRRIHRWARGDWQLLPWILGTAPKVEGRDVPRAPPFLGRWKMLDNLRRTLSAPSTLALLIAGWTFLPGSALAWTAFVVATLAVPAAVPVVGSLVPRRRGAPLGPHLKGVAFEARDSLARIAASVAFLPQHAGLMVDAVGRTLVRLYVTRRRLLEWTPAALADRGLGGGVVHAYRRMWRTVASSVTVVVGVVILRPGAAAPALSLGALWVAAPALVWWLSRPLRPPESEELDREGERYLRRVARESWRYFEETVSEETNGLPPDNLQEDPEIRVAHRSSPTNVGCYLLALVSARDLGWIGTDEALEQQERVLGTLETMERFKGHYFNWYDVRTLLPLEPRYVSTVDSGNLAGHLLTSAEACREWATGPLPSSEAVLGIADGVDLARRAVTAAAANFRGGTISRHDLEVSLDRVTETLEAAPEEREGWSAWLERMSQVAETFVDVVGAAAEQHTGQQGWAAASFWADAVRRSVASHRRDLRSGDQDESDREAAETRRRLRHVAARWEAVAREIDFRLVYDPGRKLFSIGYRVAEGELDEGYYDLLASEARLASLVAVATGDVGVEHWFHLGRTVTSVDHGAALVSWAGSMFEYLMPLLVMDPPPGTALEETQRLVVRRQMQYGRERGVPWGVSESAYNARDLQLTYQYSHFGLPGLGLARGLADDLVVAPYATALAAMVTPAEAVRNFRRLEAVGARGARGFYEAVDYTPDRLPKGHDRALVRAYMAHHQGMTIAALANVVLKGRHRERFHRVPMVRSVEVLLQERIPRDVVVTRPRREELETIRHVRELTPPVARHFNSPHLSPPATHLLSNGRYTVMVTAAGAGYSRVGPTAVTRWRTDVTRDHWGSFVYLRDVESGETWSAGWQPTGVEPDRYEVLFTEDRAEFSRRDGAISTTMEVVVSPEEDGELRRIVLKNQGSRVREIEVTSYAEVVLTSGAADAAHPAFEKLFVQTAFDAASGALLATRRAREDDERDRWACHVAAVEGETVGPLQYETDRARFIERGRDSRAPACVAEGRPLSNSVGAVLDPVFSLHRTLRIRPGATARVTFSTLVAETREEAVNLAAVHRDPAAFERAAGLAWTQAQVQLQHLGVGADEAHLFQRLASHLLYPDGGLRARDESSPDHRGQQTLWRYGISGDAPLLLVQIDQVRDRELVRQLVRGHEYWAWKGLDVDLVIVNEHAVTYADDLQEWIRRLLGAGHGAGRADEGERGRVHLLRAGNVEPADRAYLRSVARVSLHARDGSLAEQLEAVQREEEAVTRPGRVPAPEEVPEAPPAHPELRFYNGLGGFAKEGRQYVIVLGEGQWTPAPWVNVVANPEVGFVASETGSGYTWAANSRENRLTPWSNDPVSDPPGEVMYVRDEESGQVWTPTPLPIREVTPYRIVHSQGWSRFEHEGHGIALELTQFVPTDDPVKISRLRLRNESGRRRRLSVTAYAEWVLGVRREVAAPHVTTAPDASTGALFARNGWNQEFAGRVAFADLGGEHDGWTADRTEFLGRHGTTSSPAALTVDTELSRSAGSGLDPCAVLRRGLTLVPGEEAEVVFLLGQGVDADEARSLVRRYRAADLDEVLEAARDRWDDVLGALQVEVPDASMEPMLNRWLLYQTLSCRVYARSAFYQSGGAFGFRDQLQDVMALTVCRRDVAREHLLRAASRQFPEGDVQHWWHPPSGRGVRTRIADDLLWLPFALLHYLEVTGDTSVLDEEVPFVEGSELEEGEQERYFEPHVSDATATIFEHCARAVDARLEGGPHGLPLMGAGDWNDGMNRVGHRGRGESVWMGWFLHLVLQRLTPLAASRGEDTRAERWHDRMESLAEALERHGWDGDWYRRAYFDDGTPLGSSENDECRIDSIAQSWAVLSGVAGPYRRRRAMQSVYQYLVRRGDALVLLFTPPFDDGELDPGYISGYLPGVRENGGQYTHAAIWSVLALAELGMGDQAVELFSILNPVNQASTRAGVHRYKVEPYVSVGDVYAEPPHVGRGGWSWYTGSAGWMYRAGIEWILGFRLRGDTLRIDPCVPREWPGYRMSFQYHSARYEIEVESPNGVMRGVVRAELDGRLTRLGEERTLGEESAGPPEPRVDVDGAWLPLTDDGDTHSIRVWLGDREDD